MLVINPLTLQALKSKLLVVYTCAQVSKRVNFVIDTRVEVSTLRRLLLSVINPLMSHSYKFPEVVVYTCAQAA